MEGAREVAWAVSRTGDRPDDNDRDYGTLVRDVSGAWTQLFPRRLGYRTELAAADEHRTRLVVRRGDFSGQVELCLESGRVRGPSIRAFARACSEREQVARALGRRVVRRAQVAATVAGAVVAVWVMALSYLWVSGGVQMPVVGGMILTTLTAALLVGGSSVGARIGEGVARRLCASVEDELRRDAGVQADIERWNRLSRQLRSHRRDLARRTRGGPFRREAV